MKKNFDNELLNQKETLIDNAIKTLKEEFVGINEQIDCVMDNLRTWFLFPELQTRPLVISLWGMSGVGKTSLVKRIAELLDIEKDMVYFNFAEIGECSSWEIENELEEKLSNEKSNRMFVYDEFQYAATIDKHGEEILKKSGLKPFWELLDTGKIRKRDDFWVVKDIQNVLRYMQKINNECPIKLENGVWVNCNDCLKNFPEYDILQFSNFFNWKSKERNSDTSVDSIRLLEDTPRERKGDFFLRDGVVDKVLNQYDKGVDRITDRLDKYHELEKMNFDELFNFIERVFHNAKRGYDINFSDSVVLVLGNLDESYDMAFNVNPDMSPDQFHKITKKLNIVDIKKGLQQRFRNEQIARLGNIHVIYPSFSSESFRKIIELNLNSFAKDVKEKIGLELEFKNSIIDLIYKESVFPTHGTRPVFSSIHEIVRSKLPSIVRNIYENAKGTDRIVMSYRGKHTVVDCLDSNGNIIFNKKYKEKLRLENERKTTKDNQQALTALHESGHFVVYASLFGRMPEKLCSKTTSKQINGFLMHDDKDDVPSKENLLNRITVSLAGYAAEQLIFGKDCVSSGAESDLRNATEIASKMIRDYGMGSNTIATCYYTEGSNCRLGHVVKEFDDTKINREIESIVEDCLETSYNILRNPEWRKMLKKSALYLCNHSSMPKKKMKQLYMEVDKTVRELPDKESFYRGCIEKL